MPPISERENYLRTIEMREPEWIPCNVSFLQPAWHKYREKIEDIILRHPSIFGEYVRGSRDFNNFGSRRRGHIYKDEWGCAWSFLIDGLQGQVRSHPVEDWSAFQSYKPPDPSDSIGPPREGSPPNESWIDVKKRIRDRKERQNSLRLLSTRLPIPAATLSSRIQELDDRLDHGASSARRSNRYDQ